MTDDAEVLRFRGPRGEEPPAGGGRDDWLDEYGADDVSRGGYLSADLAQLTQVVVIGDRVVDVVRRSALGSDYECAALELEDERRRRRRPPPPPEPPVHELQLDWLARIVGGADVLAGLDTHPLPEEGLDLSTVPRHLHDRVVGLDEAVAGVAPVLLGSEGLTAARRLLVRAVSCEPGVLTRSDRDDIASAAVVWAVARGNDLAGPSRPVRASAVSALFGLRSSPAQRGAAFARAAGGGLSPLHPRRATEPDVVPLGDPALLLGRFRQRLVSLRDLALALRAATPVA